MMEMLYNLADYVQTNDIEFDSNKIMSDEEFDSLLKRKIYS